MRRDWLVAVAVSLCLHGAALGCLGLWMSAPSGSAGETALEESAPSPQDEDEKESTAAGRGGRGRPPAISISMVVSPQVSGAAEGYNAGMVVVKTTPDYPLISRLWGEEGTARVLLSVQSGEVTSVALERSSGSPRLDRAACEALGRWRFRPEVAGVVRIPVTFRLGGRK